MKDIISVIIPVYNVEKYLEECVLSVIWQSYRELEIILVDDGSTDLSLDICNKYAEQDERIVVIHQENKGLSGARNTGIDNAHGKYIVFVDSDDYIHHNMIEKLYVALNETEADIAICSFECVYMDDKDHEKIENPIKNEILNKDGMFQKLFERDNWYYSVAINKLYKREIWEKLKFPEGYINEDVAVVHHVFSQCEKMASIEEKLYYYRQRPGSIMNSGRNIARLDKYSACADRLFFFDKYTKKYNMNMLAWQFFHGFFDDYYYFDKVNDKMHRIKRMKKLLWQAMPIMIKIGFLSFKDTVSAIVFLLSPSIYKRIWRK